MSRRLEWGLLGLLLVVGAWLRFSHLDLLQFQSDEAIASHLAWQFVNGGPLPTEALTSSVGVANPPLLIYLLIPMFAVTSDPAGVVGMIAALGLGAVGLTWWIGRRYYGPVAGLIAGGMFAVAPWAVIYSRQIWAQDFLPLFAVGAMWAVHALVLGKQPRAVFWVVLLALGAIQIHFAGLALAAGVLVIGLWLRPRVDWRWAVAGLVAGLIPLLPYLRTQNRSGWQDFRRGMSQLGGQAWEIPAGLRIQPNSGYPLPRPPSEAGIHALAIMNTGEIEDVLGLSAARAFDRNGIWERKRGEYFEAQVGGTGWVLLAQRGLFAGGLVWLLVVGVRGRRNRQDPAVQAAWLLVLWVVGPLMVFMGTRLLTYLSYYVILWPAHFLVCGAVGEALAGKVRSRLGRLSLTGALLIVLAANFTFMQKLYGFVNRHGGAQGTYGTVLAHKWAAARFLAERANARELMESGRLLQVDQPGREEVAQVELPWLAMVLAKQSTPTVSLPTNTVVLVVDENRTNFDPQLIQELANKPQTNFGPLRLYLPGGM